MYVIKDERQHSPMAIVTEDSREKIIRAIKEEFSFESVVLDNFLYPDYGESFYVGYTGTTEDGDSWDGIITLTKLVSY